MARSGKKTLRVGVIDCGSSKVTALLRILDSEGVPCERIPLKDANGTSFGRYGALILSGGPHLFTVDDEKARTRLQKQFKFLKRTRRPILGICLGHQALALYAGGTVELGEPRRKEDVIRIVAPHPLFEGIDDATAFAEDHCEGITLPPGYTLLAGSEHYTVEAMANEDLQRYGVQFHPESSHEAGRRLIQNFLYLARQPRPKRPKRRGPRPPIWAWLSGTSALGVFVLGFLEQTALVSTGLLPVLGLLIGGSAFNLVAAKRENRGKGIASIAALVLLAGWIWLAWASFGGF